MSRPIWVIRWQRIRVQPPAAVHDTHSFIMLAVTHSSCRRPVGPYKVSHAYHAAGDPEPVPLSSDGIVGSVIQLPGDGSIATITALASRCSQRIEQPVRIMLWLVTL